MVKQNYYLQTLWVENNIKKEKEMRSYRIYIQNFEKKMAEQHGANWQKVSWDGLNSRTRSGMINNRNMKEEIDIWEKTKNDPKNQKPPPLEYSPKKWNGQMY